MSILNTLVARAGDSHAYDLGLAATMLFDSFASHMQKQGAAVFWALASVVFDLAVFGMFVACGWRARGGNAHAFAVGGVLFLGDTLLLLVSSSLLHLLFFVISLLIHARILFALFCGWTASSGLRQLDEQPVAVV